MFAMTCSVEKISETFVADLTSLLEHRDIENALKLIVEASDKTIKQNASDIICTVTIYFTESVSESEKELFICSETILNTVAEICNPMEIVLEFLQHIEFQNNNIKFCAILKALSTCMMRMKNKVTAIEWCVSTIKSYVEELPTPDDDADQDAASYEIMKVYKSIISFLEPLVHDATKMNAELEEASLLENYLLSLLISLCGKPFCYLNQNIVEKVMYKELLHKIMLLTYYLTEDLLCFLNIVSDRYKNVIHNEAQDNRNENCIRDMLFELSDNVSSMAYANYYFHIMTKEKYWVRAPQVYSPYYFLEMCAYLIKVLLCKKQIISVSNGLTFMENIIERIPLCSVNSDVLGIKVYSDLFEVIAKIMIYCDDDTERKKAVHIFQKYIEIFDMEAKFLIVRYLYEISEHSGLLSLITSIIKSSIIKCLNSNPPDHHFLGKNLEILLKNICKLSHGSSTDLVEISDEVISALNLLRFLFIRDKHNETGIWNIKDEIKRDYLQPLREGLDLCKTHWKVKLKDLEQQKKTYAKLEDCNEIRKADAEITLTIGGEQLPVMPPTEKITFCYQAINGLDVMESIYTRVIECINTFNSVKEALLADQFKNNNTNTDAHTHQTLREENDEEYENNIKTKILSASLKYVPDLGWSKHSIIAGASSIGYPGVIHGLFPNGGADLIRYFYKSCNQELNEILKKEALASIKEDPSKLQKTPQQIVRDAVETRLRMIIPYKKTWSQAMAIMTLPSNVPTSLANLLTLIDDICYFSGDRSVDTNWYVRRMTLGSIYKATELYMLQDTSEDHKETWSFLDKRIKEALQIYMIFSQSGYKPLPDDVLSRATDTTVAVFETARNMLGLRWK